MSKMQFKYWGICKYDGMLMGDATAVDDFTLWAKSRGIDPTKPFGERPVPPEIEEQYKHHPCYVKQSDADTMFKNESEWGAFGD